MLRLGFLAGGICRTVRAGSEHPSRTAWGWSDISSFAKSTFLDVLFVSSPVQLIFRKVDHSRVRSQKRQCFSKGFQ
jgi:hypothetical protein